MNPNTVARAFQELQSEGLTETLRGRGVVVCKGSLERCRKDRKSLFTDRIATVLTEALHGGLSADEIRKLVERKLKSLDGKVATISTKPPD